MIVRSENMKIWTVRFNSVAGLLAMLCCLFCLVSLLRFVSTDMTLTANKQAMLALTVALCLLSATWAACCLRFRCKELLVNLNLALLSFGFFSPLLGEIAIRVGIHANIEVFKNPELYADSYSSDDYWSLLALWKPPFIAHVDPLLGWSPEKTPENPLGVSRPMQTTRQTHSLLFFGDSFVAPQGNTPCIPELLQASLALPVYNYGVAGYGLDQILIRVRQETPHFNQPRLFVGVLTLDIDRTILNIRGAVKPRFALYGDTLAIQNTPIPSLSVWLEAHPVTFRSYYVALVRRFIDLFAAGLDDKRVNHRQAEKQAVTRALLRELSREHNNLTVVLFYQLGELAETGWRETCLKAALTEFSIPYLDTKPLLLADAKAHGLDLSTYYDATDHHNERGNTVIAAGLTSILYSRTLQPSSGQIRP
jgi:hypothetical protein